MKPADSELGGGQGRGGCFRAVGPEVPDRAGSHFSCWLLPIPQQLACFNIDIEAWEVMEECAEAREGEDPWLTVLQFILHSPTSPHFCM